MRKVKIQAAFLIVLLICCAAADAKSRRIPATFFGMTIAGPNNPFPSIPFGTHRFWDTVGTAWPFLNPGPGVYRWEALDAMLRRLKAAGVSAGFYTLSRTPTWASENPDDRDCEYYSGSGPHGPGQCDPPKDLNPDGTGPDQIWRNWVSALAAHVESLDPKKYLRVRYWEPWNEIHISSTLDPEGRFRGNSYNGTFAQLVRMTQDARCIIKGSGSITATGETCSQVLKSVGLSAPVDPPAMIVMPSSSTYPGALEVASNFLYCNAHPSPSSLCITGDAGAKSIDATNFHIKLPTSPAENVLTVLDKVRSILKPSELKKPLIDGESGYAHPENHPGSINGDADMKASFVARFHLLQWSSGVSVSNWYTWDQPGDGFWTPQGGINKAGIAYGEVYRWMVGAVMPRPCENTGTLWECALTRPDGYRAEAIWDTSRLCRSGSCQTVNRKVSPIYKQYRDLSGKIFPVRNSRVPVGIKPILLENRIQP